MNGPSLAGPDAPQPFSPDAGKSKLGGCGKPVVIGCTVLLVLTALALMLLLSKAKELFTWSMERVEQQVVAALPQDLPDADRQRLTAAFAAVRQAVLEGRADPQALLDLQGELRGVGAGERLDRERVQRITEALEAAAGQKVEAPPSDSSADP